MQDSITGPNPSGLCMCGCGASAPIAAANDIRYGIVKGKPQRYIKSHNQYKSFEPYIVDKNGCWVWQRAVNSAGYGHLYVDGVHKYAHVHYYEMAHGAISGIGRERTSNQVHHKCGNKLCVNPDHLEVKSTGDHRKGHGITRLTSDDVREIRRLYATGKYSQRAIAKMFGIKSQSHISGIVSRRFWSHIA